MIVLDASVLIAHLDGEDRHHAAATRLLATTGGEALGASPITLAETLVAPARADRLEEVEDALRRLRVAALPLSDGAAAQLARLRAETKLKMPDCCVLLAAEEHDGAVAGFDSNLVAAARARGLRTAAMQ